MLSGNNQNQSQNHDRPLHPANRLAPFWPDAAPPRQMNSDRQRAGTPSPCRRSPAGAGTASPSQPDIPSQPQQRPPHPPPPDPTHPAHRASIDQLSRETLSDLLVSFLYENESLVDLASRLDLSLEQIIVWHDHPATQAMLHHLARITRSRARHKRAGAKADAVAALQHIARFKPDSHPETARKSAAAILKPPPRTRRRPPRAQPDSAPPTPSPSPATSSTAGYPPPLSRPRPAPTIPQLSRRHNQEQSTMPVTISETAAREIKTIIQQQELDASKVRLRVGVKGGGCSGFSYLLDLTENQKDTDEEFEQHGVKVICDPKSLLYLNGVTVDFKDEIMGRGFVFNNPNATASCGCGSSFSV